ncbi:hypothetical protein AB0F17_61915 [Nonomuraea sp. NPDC026600]|uniref:hypothetical protein n=1 Tax=Nonomuraea sp. NPDC026600 TaxID=3155363 RepID=UPI0033F5FD35
MFPPLIWEDQPDGSSVGRIGTTALFTITPARKPPLAGDDPVARRPCKAWRLTSAVLAADGRTTYYGLSTAKQAKGIATDLLAEVRRMILPTIGELTRLTVDGNTVPPDHATTPAAAPTSNAVRMGGRSAPLALQGTSSITARPPGRSWTSRATWPTTTSTTPPRCSVPSTRRTRPPAPSSASTANPRLGRKPARSRPNPQSPSPDSHESSPSMTSSKAKRLTWSAWHADSRVALGNFNGSRAFTITRTHSVTGTILDRAKPFALNNYIGMPGPLDYGSLDDAKERAEILLESFLTDFGLAPADPYADLATCYTIHPIPAGQPDHDPGQAVQVIAYEGAWVIRSGRPGGDYWDRNPQRGGWYPPRITMKRFLIADRAEALEEAHRAAGLDIPTRRS